MTKQIDTLFATARDLAFRIGELQGVDGNVPNRLMEHYQRVQDELWVAIERSHGECKCGEDYVDCPTIDIHSRYWLTLDDAEESGRIYAELRSN